MRMILNSVPLRKKNKKLWQRTSRPSCLLVPESQKDDDHPFYVLLHTLEDWIHLVTYARSVGYVWILSMHIVMDHH